MEFDLIIENCRLGPASELADIGIRHGTIATLESGLTQPASRRIDAGGRVVLPGLIDAHIHPDKAFLEEKMPNRSGTLGEAMKNTQILKSSYSGDDIYARAARVLDLAVSRGTTTLRVHPDVDAVVGLMGVQTLLDLKDAYRNLVDLQVVAFPQEGIFHDSLTEGLMVEALRAGADVVGGCPYSEQNGEHAHRHVDWCFDLASRYDKPLDMHVDLSDSLTDPRYTLAEYVAEQAIQRGMQGRVTLGHVVTLGLMPYEQRMRILDKLAQAQITIVILPSTDLYLGGRDQLTPWRGMAPLRDMISAGINVAYASNNIRNAFTPYGTADMLQMGLLLANTAHMGTTDELQHIVLMATANPARALGIADHYGVKVGAQADLIVLDTKRFEDVLLDQPERLYVIKRGRVVVSTRKETWTEKPDGPVRPVRV